MNARYSIVLAVTSLGLLAAGLVLAGPSASARATHEIIRVQTPRQVKHELLPRNRGEAEVLAASVQYGDLDLNSEAGARALEDRIVAAANEVCTTLSDMYPESEYGDEVGPSVDVCARRAANQAMAAARTAIDKARAARG